MEILQPTGATLPYRWVVDGGSTDGSAEVLDLYASQHENLFVVH